MRRLLPLILTLACGSPTTDSASPLDCPRLSVDPDTVRWDDVLFASPSVRAVQLTNPCGGSSVVIDSLDVDGDAMFGASTEAAVVEAGQTVTVEITYTPADYGPHAAALIVRSSAGDLTLSMVGRVESDQDGDGVAAIGAGGQDCDDEDPRVGAPTTESDNGVDDDCDGLVDEDFVQPGDVWLTEVMLRPGSVRTNVGQWVEVYNPSARTVNLKGWELAGTDGRLTVAGDVELAPGGLAVLSATPDPQDNGGIQVDGTLVGPGNPLAIRDWSLSLQVDGLTIAALDDSPDWPDVLGSAISLDPTTPSVGDATQPAWWCPATSVLPNADLGTPGTTNDWCPQIDHDQDGFSAAEGDCDDTDAQVGRFAREVWDRKDNDCDGFVDDLLADEANSGQVSGSTYLPFGEVFHVWDYDSDGIDEVILSDGQWVGSGLIVMSGDDAHASAGLPYTGIDHGIIEASRSSFMGLAPQPADLYGNGDLDLMLPLTSAVSNEALWVADGVPGSGVTWTAEDMVWVVEDPERSRIRAASSIAHLDLDGDGAPDPIMADDRDNEGLVTLLEPGTGRTERADSARSSWVGAERSGVGAWLGGGDIDDDGYDDLFVAEADPWASAKGTPIRIVNGAEAVPDSGALGDVVALELTGLSGRPGARAWLFDIDEDGSDDLVVGEPAQDIAYIVFDAPSLSGSIDVPAVADVSVVSDRGRLGMSAAWGDVDRDGVLDLVLGGPDLELTDRGVVMVMSSMVLTSGASPLDSNDATVTILAAETGDRFGTALSIADLDGDGRRDELLVVAPRGVGTGDFTADLWTFERP